MARHTRVRDGVEIDGTPQPWLLLLVKIPIYFSYRIEYIITP
jgi:hypothetical protein